MSTVLRTLALLCAAAPISAQHPNRHVLVGKSPNAQYGSSITVAGDVDGDGCPDFLVGAPIDNRTTEKSGALELRSGRTMALLRTWLGPGKGDELGFAGAGAGDVDGDGTPDILCGVLGGVGPERSFIGNARVYSGKTGARLYTFVGRDWYDYFGLSVFGLLDLDGDHHAEFAIGCPGDDGSGRDHGKLEIHDGATGALIRVLRGDVQGGQFGWNARNVGDLDGDGHADIAIGAPGHVRPHDPTGLPGLVRVHSGKSGEKLFQFDGEAKDDHFGWSVSALGDIDADGTPDFAIGAPFTDFGGTDCGSVYLISGKSGTRIRRIDGSQPGARFGWCVFGTDDYDHDGEPELWITAPNENRDAADDKRGTARLFSAQSGTALLTLYGDAPKGEFGFSLADLGPVLADGTHRIVVGARSDDVGRGQMVGTATAIEIAPARGDAAPRDLSAETTVEAVDLAKIEVYEAPKTLPMPSSGHLAMLGVGAITLVVLGAAYALWRR
ncbi:MAG: integrin alpha [Planctomycetota bacterium]